VSATCLTHRRVDALRCFGGLFMFVPPWEFDFNQKNCFSREGSLACSSADSSRMFRKVCNAKLMAAEAPGGLASMERNNPPRQDARDRRGLSARMVRVSSPSPHTFLHASPSGRTMQPRRPTPTHLPTSKVGFETPIRESKRLFFGPYIFVVSHIDSQNRWLWWLWWVERWN
jgi:hypothetical protein